ncbi:MAG: TetR/AcrR family transcriptional regulator [Solirubrobacterales bacterium]
MSTESDTNVATAADSESAADRPLRADAQRNRERIIEAASEAFRELGLDASVAEIARRADVGSGTLFRNYPSKEDLIYAVIEARMQEWTHVAERALTEPDAAKAFEEFMLTAADAQYRDRGLFEAFKEGLLDKPELFDCKERAVCLSEEVLKRAQQAGAVRADVNADDLGNLTAAAAAAAERSGGGNYKDSPYARYMRILLDGLKP